MWARVLPVFFAATLMASSASADPLAVANEAYDSYEFEVAIKQFKVALSSLTPPEKRAEAHVKLAFSYFISQQQSLARGALATLFQEQPAHVLDRKGVHPDLLKFYDAERAKVPVPVAPTPPPSPSTQAKVNAAPPYEPAHIVVRLLPLGIGQFANGDPIVGGVFLGTELLLVAVNIATAVSAGKTCNARFEQCTDIGKEMALFVTQNVSAALLIGVTVFGIIDAIVWSPDRAEARYKENNKLSLVPTLSVSKDGGSFAFVGRF